MDDDELTRALRAIEERAILAQGMANATTAMLTGVLVKMIVDGNVAKEAVIMVADSVLLTFEKQRELLAEGDRRTIDISRTQLENLLSRLRKIQV